jgi:hypothetical protein
VGRYGILFFSDWAMRRFGVHFAVPFLEVSGRRLRATKQIGEPIVRGNAEPIAAEKTAHGLAHESIVIELGEAARSRFLIATKRVGGLAARTMYLAVVEIVIAEPSAQVDPQQPRPRRHRPPCW